MLTVHHLNNSRSQRVLWLLEELGAPYEVKRYERTKDLQAPRHFLHYAEGSAMPPLFLMLVLQMIPDRAPFFAKPILKTAMEKVDEMLVKPQMALHLDHWERSIEKTGWFGYEYHPRLREFLQRIHARPAYRQGLKRGGPYAYA